MFYGIIIHMQNERGGRHHVPHVHCLYGEIEAVYAIDGLLLEGEFPPNKHKLVLAWLSLHEEELRANWKLLSEGQQYFKIVPLQ